MQLYKCEKCQHEWEAISRHLCDWCGGESYMLDKKTQSNGLIDQLNDIQDEMKYIRKNR